MASWLGVDGKDIGRLLDRFWPGFCGATHAAAWVRCRAPFTEMPAALVIPIGLPACLGYLLSP
jgi:hypothetical protein